MEFEEENTVTVQDLFQSLAERLQQSANVSSVFGEPIAAQGRTIIPVAKISYGFGGGAAGGVRRRVALARKVPVGAAALPLRLLA